MSSTSSKPSHEKTQPLASRLARLSLRTLQLLDNQRDDHRVCVYLSIVVGWRFPIREKLAELTSFPFQMEGSETKRKRKEIDRSSSYHSSNDYLLMNKSQSGSIVRHTIFLSFCHYIESSWQRHWCYLESITLLTDGGHHLFSGSIDWKLPSLTSSSVKFE